MFNTKPIPEEYAANFDTLVRAAKNDRLALISALDKTTGEPRYVIVAVSDTDSPEDIDLVPFGHLSDDPYGEYDPPRDVVDIIEEDA